MPYLIDGHNLIGKQGKLGQSGCEEELINEVQKFCFRKNKKAAIVFDGRSFSKEELGPVHVHYSDPGYSADEVIKDIVHAEPNKQGLIVISSDNEIKDFARREGTQILSSEEFDNLLKRQEESGQDVERGEISNEEARDWERWMKEH